MIKKNITSSLLCVFCAIQMFAKGNSTVILNLHADSYNQNIEIYTPLDGAYNYFISTDKFSCGKSISNMNLKYIYNSSYPAFILVKVADRSFEIILTSDGNVTIDIYPEENSPNWIVFSGSNALGQKWYNDWNYVPWKKMITTAKIFDDNQKDYTTIFKEINKYIDVTVKNFDSIAKANSMQNEFQEAIKKEIHSAIYSDVLSKYNYILSGKKYGNISKSDSLLLFSIKRQIYAIHPPLTADILASKYGCIYLDSYLRSNQVQTKIIGNDYKQFGTYNIYNNLPDELQKPILGKAILLQYLYSQNEFDKENGIRIFKEKFPNSQYLPIISAFYEKNKLSKKQDIRFDDEIHVDTTENAQNLRTIKELHNTFFKGKKIFIDIWATWCAPCKLEFSHNNELGLLIKKYNIPLVFISIDEFQFKNKWINDIYHLNLKGYHFLVNESLMTDIKEKIYSNQSLIIPRYVYIDEKGEIITNDAPRPSSIKALDKLFHDL